MNVTNKYIFKILIVFFSCLIMVSFTEECKIPLCILILGLSLFNVVRSRSNWSLLIIYGFIAYSNYSICISNHLFPISNFFTHWRNESVDLIGLKVLYLFVIIITILYPSRHKLKNINFFENNPSNSVIVLCSCVLLVLIFFYGFTRPDISGERGSASTIYEYAIIIFIVAFYYSAKRIEKITLTIILLFFVVQNLIYGGRSTAIQLIICWFIIFVSQRISVKKALPYIILLAVIFTGIGNMRANWSLDLENIFNTIFDMADSKLTMDTAYSAYYTSLSFVKVAQQTTWSQRIYFFICWLISIFLGGVVPNSNLAIYTRKFYVHYYGGVLPFFGFFYLGYAGVVVIAIYISKVIKNFLSEKNNGLNKCINIYVVSAVPRWYLYSPSPLFRGFLLLCIVYVICNIFHKAVKRNYCINKNESS